MRESQDAMVEVYIRKRALYTRKRALYTRKRGLYTRKRGLYTRKRGLSTIYMVAEHQSVLSRAPL